MLHPQILATAGIRRRPSADVLAAGPDVQLKFIRDAMEESNEAETGPVLPLPVVADLVADGVPCRLYAKAANAPVFVYAHGGGWCYGSIETVDRFCRRVADRSGCSVLSVGYRPDRYNLEMDLERSNDGGVRNGIAADQCRAGDAGNRACS
jgi:acetyl esterase